MIKGILFDFNGTMVFDGPQHKKAWNVFSLQYRNCPIQDAELDRMHGQTNKKIIQMLLNDTLSEKEVEQLSIRKEALYRECCLEDPTYALVDGLTSLLDTLKAHHIPMTICSASIKDNIDFFIDHFQLATWFSTDNIVYDDGTHTDKISMFHEGAKNIQVPIKECVVIEDSLSGISFAHACNVAKIIAITTKEKFAEYQELDGVNQTILDYVTLNMEDLMK